MVRSFVCGVASMTSSSLLSSFSITPAGRQFIRLNGVNGSRNLLGGRGVADQSQGLTTGELSMIERLSETIVNTVARALGHDCHVMFGAAAVAPLDEPKQSVFSFSCTASGTADSVYRGLGVTVIVSRLRMHPRSARCERKACGHDQRSA